MNMVFGDAIRGRQLPHVEPQAASMGCPQLGHDCSSIRAGAVIMTPLISSGVEVLPALLHPREALVFGWKAGLDLRGFKTVSILWGLGRGRSCWLRLMRRARRPG
jgi:hypothetical protein